MTVHIMVGCSGSGKSTLAHKLAPSGAIFSADNWFTAADGVYRFNATHLSRAHGACLREFTNAVRRGCSAIAVDNTNSTVMEAAPYIALALAFGQRVVIHVLRMDPIVAHARNTHGVPLASVQRMAESIARGWPAALPWHWRPENEAAISIVEEGKPR